MTNKEKFIEIMNSMFNMGLTEENFRFNRERYSGVCCSPCGMYKARACLSLTCKECEAWWDKEYKEVKQNDD